MSVSIERMIAIKHALIYRVLLHASAIRDSKNTWVMVMYALTTMNVIWTLTTATKMQIALIFQMRFNAIVKLDIPEMVSIVKILTNVWKIQTIAHMTHSRVVK